MRTPTTSTVGCLEVTRIIPQTDAVTRVKITIPLDTVADRMLAPLYAELLQRGTKTKTRDAFADALEKIGAELSISSDSFGITISGCTLSEHLTPFLRLMSEMLRAPAFNPKEITQVHIQYRQALHDEADNARTRAYNTFTQLLYTKAHPYYRPSVATRRTALKSITRKTYVDLHTRLLRRPRIVSISGTQKAQEAILALFALTETSADSSPYQLIVPAHDAITQYQSVPGKTNVELFIGNTFPLTLSDQTLLPFQFGLSVLGKWGGFSGRLMSTVREKQGLTYTIYARTEGITTDRSGMWYIFTFFTPKDLTHGITSTTAEIKKIIEKGITETELVRFKELLKNQFTLAHESDAKTLALYHDARCAGMTATALVAQYDAIAGLTKKDVNSALRQYLDPDKIVISGAGPV